MTNPPGARRKQSVRQEPSSGKNTMSLTLSILTAKAAGSAFLPARAKLLQWYRVCLHILTGPIGICNTEGAFEMNKEKELQELKDSLEDLKKRWPAHSVKVQMIEELERLEEEIARLEKLRPSNGLNTPK